MESINSNSQTDKSSLTSQSDLLHSGEPSRLAGVNLPPKEVVRRKIIYPVRQFQIQQVGIDLTIAETAHLQAFGHVQVPYQQSFDMQDTFGQVFVRSSFSRKGIFISSGAYDPGFKGIGGIMIYNFNKKAFTIQKGFSVVQMIVFPANVDHMYDGHYNHSNSMESKIKGDAHDRTIQS